MHRGNIYLQYIMFTIKTVQNRVWGFGGWILLLTLPGSDFPEVWMHPKFYDSVCIQVHLCTMCIATLRPARGSWCDARANFRLNVCIGAETSSLRIDRATRARCVYLMKS